MVGFSIDFAIRRCAEICAFECFFWPPPEFPGIPRNVRGQEKQKKTLFAQISNDFPLIFPQNEFCLELPGIPWNVVLQPVIFVGITTSSQSWVNSDCFFSKSMEIINLTSFCQFRVEIFVFDQKRWGSAFCKFLCFFFCGGSGIC